MTQTLPGTYLSSIPARTGLSLACRFGWSQSGFGKSVPDALSAWGCSTCQCGAAACWSRGAPWTYECPQHAGNLQRHVNEQRRKESVCWNVSTDINVFRGPVLRLLCVASSRNTARQSTLDLFGTYIFLGEQETYGLTLVCPPAIFTEVARLLGND